MQRRREAEWMDDPDAGDAQLRLSLRFIRRINFLLGYTRATLTHLDSLTRNWPAGQPLNILDVATGSGDVPQAILRWADRRGLDMRISGIDLHERTLQTAASENGDPRFRLVRGDATRLPFADGSYHFAVCSMFLHHLDEDVVVAVLRELDRVSSVGVIVSDLLRHRSALTWISLMTLLANPMVRHDARVSVRQAFTRDEVLRLRDRAELRYADYCPHFGHRFVLSGMKKPFGARCE
jgi:2-polyprenyl-3-methyl-5-hydroxy-6-metoxy-1,4-benzoquinol methylase